MSCFLFINFSNLFEPVWTGKCKNGINFLLREYVSIKSIRSIFRFSLLRVSIAAFEYTRGPKTLENVQNGPKTSEFNMSENVQNVQNFFRSRRRVPQSLPRPRQRLRQPACGSAGAERLGGCGKNFGSFRRFRAFSDVLNIYGRFSEFSNVFERCLAMDDALNQWLTLRPKPNTCQHQLRKLVYPT